MHMMSRYRFRTATYKALIYLLLAVLVVLVLYPFTFAVSTSLSLESNVYKRPPKILPRPLSIEGYREAWQQLNFPLLYFNSVFVAVAATLLSVTFNSMAAFVFARRVFPGRDTIFLLFLATMMIPFQVTIIPLFLTVKTFGLLDTYIGLLCPWAADAFSIFLIRQYMKKIPLDFDESAVIDGSSELIIFSRIILPIAKPIVVSVAIFKFMWVYNNLIWPLVVVQSSRLWTLPLGLATLTGEYGGQRIRVTVLMAAAVTSMVLPVIAYVYAQKHFIKGLTAGAIKE